MPINILMPALSPTMEKGNLAKWLKKEGDKVKSGDLTAEIETDKATMEYEAVDEGTLAKIVVPEGTQDVAVNSVIAVLAGEGEDGRLALPPPQEARTNAAMHSERMSRRDVRSGSSSYDRRVRLRIRLCVRVSFSVGACRAASPAGGSSPGVESNRSPARAIASRACRRRSSCGYPSRSRTSRRRRR